MKNNLLFRWMEDYQEMKEDLVELEKDGSYGFALLAEGTRARMAAVEKRVKSLPRCAERLFLETFVLNEKPDREKAIKEILFALRSQSLRMFSKYIHERPILAEGTREREAEFEKRIKNLPKRAERFYLENFVLNENPDEAEATKKVLLALRFQAYRMFDEYKPKQKPKPTDERKRNSAG